MEDRVLRTRKSQVRILASRSLRPFRLAAGANPLQIAEALGHSDKTGRPDPTLVWKRYGHLYPGSTREAISALDRHLGTLAR
jgi:hypothetical protein